MQTCLARASSTGTHSFVPFTRPRHLPIGNCYLQSFLVEFLTELGAELLDLHRPRTTEYSHGLGTLVQTTGIPQTISLSLSLSLDRRALVRVLADGAYPDLFSLQVLLVGEQKAPSKSQSQPIIKWGNLQSWNFALLR